MALVYATKDGNWSDPTVWSTGSLPTTVDDVFSNNFIVQIDGNFTVNTINNYAQAPAVLGGYFNAQPNSVLTCIANPGVVGNVANIGCYEQDFSVPSEFSTLNASIECVQNGTSNRRGITIKNVGTLYLNGNIGVNNTHNLNQVGVGVFITGGGSIVMVGDMFGSLRPGVMDGIVAIGGLANITITGDINAPTAANRIGVNISNGAILNITGNISSPNGQSTGNAVRASNSSVVNITGNLTSIFSGGDLVFASSDTVLTVTGTVTGGFNFTGTGNSTAINSLNCTIIGDAYGGNAQWAFGAALIGAGLLIGNAFGGPVARNPALFSTQLIRHVGNGYASTASPAYGGTGEIEIEGSVFAGPNGITPFGGGIIKIDPSSISSFSYPFFSTNTPTNDPLPLFPAESLIGVPSETDVRVGTTFGATLQFTGELAVPNPATVLNGVPTDNTTGTLNIAQQVWNTQIDGTFDSGSIGDKMKNVSTVAVTAAQISALK